MSNKSPVFPMTQPPHFSDYGFDPQIDYFQVSLSLCLSLSPSLSLSLSIHRSNRSFSVILSDASVSPLKKVLEEARKHKQKTSSTVEEALHFKLQKPISGEDLKNTKKTKKKKKKKKRWWRNALLFWRWKWTHDEGHFDDDDVHHARTRAFRASVSGPVYITENVSGSSTPRRKISRPMSGPLAGTLTPIRKEEVEISYLSLRELTLEQQQYHQISTSAMPIYLVT
ncbi:hypothetical protein HHK36_012371 [Tetracentron sinense]|uniref:Uncharacterized protein n=1 Tax=Tetracentron sinense TaxID=13715 RepID=A0A835DI17_TETSI|nr:hypothetical protein HHK36_012371 [Tetracentron sinense]